MQISNILKPEAVRVLSAVSSKKRLMHELGDLADGVHGLDAGSVVDALLERESLGPTGVGHVPAVDLDLATFGLHQARNGVKSRRLAGPVRAQKRRNFALPDLQRHVTNDQPLLVALAQVGDPQARVMRQCEFGPGHCCCCSGWRTVLTRPFIRAVPATVSTNIRSPVMALVPCTSSTSPCIVMIPVTTL